MKDFNFKILGVIPLELLDEIKPYVSSIPTEEWDVSSNHKIFFPHTHNNLDVIVLYNQPVEDSDVYHVKMINEDYLRIFDKLLNYTRSLIEYHYPQGEFKRILLHKLLAGKDIPKHTDHGYHLETSRRIHIPIITNDNVDFTVNDETVNMNYGTIVEINNNVRHGVVNNSSEDRVHLMIDWNYKDDEYYKRVKNT